MADIDDNPEDLTLAEAISYLAFDCLLAKEDLAARQEVHSDRSKAQSAMVSEMLDTTLPGEELPKGLKPEEEKKRREELKQEEARKTRLYGGAKLDWIYSRKGDWLVFTPDDAAKIDDACNRLVRGMIDEKVTGTGRLKKDDKLNDERQNIPPGFLRSGVHVEPLSDSIDEDILLPGNFGRPLKGYRYVQINRAELVAAKRAGRPALEEASEQPVISSWNKLLTYCRTAMGREKVGQFRLLFLDKKNRLIADELQDRSSGGYSDDPSQSPKAISDGALTTEANAPAGRPSLKTEIKNACNELIANEKANLDSRTRNYEPIRQIIRRERDLPSNAHISGLGDEAIRKVIAPILDEAKAASHKLSQKL